MTVPTGRGSTTMRDVPFLPSDAAVIVTVPACTPTTRPDDETVATAPSPDVQVSARSGSNVPIESRVNAVSCVVCPTTTVSTTGVTCTAETGTGLTVTPTVAVRPSLVAVTVAMPGESPVNN